MHPAIEPATTLAKRWEGLSLVPYLCPAGYWTIGYGHLCRKDHPAITQDEAEALLEGDLSKALMYTARLCPGLLYGPTGRLSAITDFTFNLGPGRLEASTLRRKINQGMWTAVPTELRKWVWGGGRKLPGLVLRREQEIKLLGG